jgi:SAM-dependent methyltransferase
VERRLRPIVERWRTARRARPPELGDLRRLAPIDPNWGFERGRPLDRVYIERFLEQHSADIRGRVLEVGGSKYTRRFGTGVVRADVLDLLAENPNATIVGDLADAPQIPDASFDCVILTQVLQFVFDVPAALATAARILAPGGVLLATVPGITKVSAREDEAFGDWWRFTARSLHRLAANAFPDGELDVCSYGNVLTAAAFLYGLAESDLRPDEISAHDPAFEVVVALRAVKRA